MRRSAHSVVRQLAAISIAVSAGLLEPAPSLARIPEELVADAVDDVADMPSAEERKDVLLLLAHDPRPNVRRRVAESAGDIAREFPIQALELVRRMASDASSSVRSGAATGLYRVLETVPSIQRLEISCQWAVSESPSERAALAAALGLGARVPLADLMIEQLCSDDERSVRLEATRALAERCFEAPAVYRALAERLLTDADRRVRHSARRVLEELG